MNFTALSKTFNEINLSIKELFPSITFSDSLVERMVYARDAGFYQSIPVGIAFPKNESEVIDLLKYCRVKSIPITIRAGGTSLSGQTVGPGIIVDISRGFKKFKLEGSDLVRLEPGLTGLYVNTLLKREGKKIGPDPSSINAAMIGGIVSNNASGMCCGVSKNSYHSLRHIRWIMPNGNCYSTEKPSDYTLFESQEKAVFDELKSIREEIISSSFITNKIRSKYKIKNTVGYGVNAFLDFEHPMDIFAHLLVGAEGTLAFVSEVVLTTFPDQPFKATSLLVFDSIEKACEIVPLLVEYNAEAVELMDCASLRSVKHLPEIKTIFDDFEDETAAILCEFQSGQEHELDEAIQKATLAIEKSRLTKREFKISFTKNALTQQNLWKIRKGLFPSVGALRKSGTTVVLEDIAFPIENLSIGIQQLKKLFEKYRYTNAIIFGHAKDGNLHFVITPDFSNSKELQHYGQFMDDLSDVVLNLNGSLKAEHGTGRNMAPFVEKEWGSEIYNFMKRIKKASDPDNIFNPGVLINDDPLVHLKNLKLTPTIEEIADKCIECGFCEPSCPSKNLSLSPRKRIQARRLFSELTSQNDIKTFQKEFDYLGLDTCAVDGLCAVDCPVDINTGDLVKNLRNEKKDWKSNLISTTIARHLSTVEILLSLGLKLAPKFLLKKMMKCFPKNIEFSALKAKTAKIKKPDYLFFSTCAPRIMHSQAKHDSFYFNEIAKKSGLSVKILSDYGYCCGQAFHSKGFFKAASSSTKKTLKFLYHHSKGGAIPIVLDTSSCTQHLLQYSKHMDIEIIDSVDFLHDVALPKLAKEIKPKQSIFHHSVCSLHKLKNQHKARRLVSALSISFEEPMLSNCCGMAGDRGFLFPELTRSSAKEVCEQIANVPLETDFCSSSPTCNINLSFQTNKEFGSLWKIFYETINHEKP